MGRGFWAGMWPGLRPSLRPDLRHFGARDWPRRRLASAFLALGLFWLWLDADAAPAGGGDRASVVAVLDASAAAWSRGDLDGFMKSYEASPDTVYIGRSGPVRGVAAIRALYASRFGQGPGSMGQLGLSVLEYRQLGPDFALVTGRFALRKPGASAVSSSGIFTLVFHRSAAGWGIVSDHTSS